MFNMYGGRSIDLQTLARKLQVSGVLKLDTQSGYEKISEDSFLASVRFHPSRFAARPIAFSAAYLSELDVSVLEIVRIDKGGNMRGEWVL
jgi:hypothetical protein